MSRGNLGRRAQECLDRMSIRGSARPSRSHLQPIYSNRDWRQAASNNQRATAHLGVAKVAAVKTEFVAFARRSCPSAGSTVGPGIPDCRSERRAFKCSIGVIDDDHGTRVDGDACAARCAVRRRSLSGHCRSFVSSSGSSHGKGYADPLVPAVGWRLRYCAPKRAVSAATAA
jgi:hypothetical protein